MASARSGGGSSSRSSSSSSSRSSSSHYSGSSHSSSRRSSSYSSSTVHSGLGPFSSLPFSGLELFVLAPLIAIALLVRLRNKKSLQFALALIAGCLFSLPAAFVMSLSYAPGLGFKLWIGLVVALTYVHWKRSVLAEKPGLQWPVLVGSFPLLIIGGALVTLINQLSGIPYLGHGLGLLLAAGIYRKAKDPSSREQLYKAIAEQIQAVKPRYFVRFEVPGLSVIEFVELAAGAYLTGLSQSTGEGTMPFSAAAAAQLKESLQEGPVAELTLCGVQVFGFEVTEVHTNVDVHFIATYSQSTEAGRTWVQAREYWTFQSQAKEPLVWEVTQIARSLSSALDPSNVPDCERQPSTKPTRFAGSLAANLQKLKQTDPSFDKEAFETEVIQLFLDMQRCWGECDYSEVEGRISPVLKDLHSTWIKQYLARQERNIISEPKVEQIAWAEIMLDEPDQIITVRVFASMLDVTVNQNFETISGSAEQRRYCSEYWTFRRNPSHGPNWVLSLIEQEDCYLVRGAL